MAHNRERSLVSEGFARSLSYMKGSKSSFCQNLPQWFLTCFGSQVLWECVKFLALKNLGSSCNLGVLRLRTLGVRGKQRPRWHALSTCYAQSTCLGTMWLHSWNRWSPCPRRLLEPQVESEKECHIDQVAATLEAQSTDQQGASGIVHIATGQYRSTFFRGLQPFDLPMHVLPGAMAASPAATSSPRMGDKAAMKSGSTMLSSNPWNRRWV